MKILIMKILLISVLLNPLIGLAMRNTNKFDCTHMLNYYHINREIKTINGWVRVCHNDRLEYYTVKKISVGNKKALCKCLSIN